MDNKGKRKGAGNRPSMCNQWVDMSIAPKTSKWRLSQRNATSPESFSREDSSLPREDTIRHSEDVSSFEDAYLAEVKRSSVVNNDNDNMTYMAGNNWDSLLKNIVLEESDEESSDESLEDEVMEETEKEMEEPIYEGHCMPCYVSVDRLGKLPLKEQQLSRTQHFIHSSHAAMFVLQAQYGPWGIPLTPMIR